MAMLTLYTTFADNGLCQSTTLVWLHIIVHTPVSGWFCCNRILWIWFCPVLSLIHAQAESLCLISVGIVFFRFQLILVDPKVHSFVDEAAVIRRVGCICNKFCKSHGHGQRGSDKVPHCSLNFVCLYFCLFKIIKLSPETSIYIQKNVSNEL